MSGGIDSLINTLGGGVPQGAAQAGQTLGGGMAGMGQAFNPYIQAGQGALGQYGNASSAMLNPQAFYQQMMSGYTQSPQAQLAQQQGTRAANAASAASGMLGSGAEQKALQQFGQQLTAADQDNYFRKMMGTYTQGLGGLSNIAGMGLQGAGNEYGIGADLLKNQAMMQLAQSMGESTGKTGGANDLLSLIGGVNKAGGLGAIPGMISKFL